jgi:UDP-4-amino-4,6-dideoxy-N-acetyl-beta-L-altrosamine transaminase
MRNIPYSHQFIDQADMRAVVRVLSSDWLTQGPDIKEFENHLCQYTGAKYAIAVSSGTAALHIACLAAGFSKRQEVIVPANTFVATSNAVIYAGAKPVFVDIDAKTGNVHVPSMEKLLNSKTKGIIAVDFAGIPCDWKKLSAIASKKKLTIIDDASHALGASYRSGKKFYKIGCGAHADMTILSFHPLKSITTGEGGAVLTNRQDLFEKLLLLRSHGINAEKKMVTLGFNYRITDIQCALGASQIKKLDGFVVKRAAIEKYYKKTFDGNPYFDMLDIPTDVKSSHHLFPVLLKDPQYKTALFDAFRKQGLGVQTHYIPVYWHPFYRQMGYKGRYAPRAENFYAREISLPIYPALSKKDQQDVVKTVLNICASVCGKGK